MRIGISAYNLHAAELAELAVDAEAAGFASVWLGEHVVAPREYTSVHPGSTKAVQHHAVPLADPSMKLTDPLIALGAAAARTTTIELATGVYVVPLRHPLAIARLAASLQQLSAGRFVLGMGAGWLREEFEALGVDFERRFKTLEASTTILRDALRGGWVERTEGEVTFDAVQIVPTPLPVPLVLGGNSGPAIRRAARIGDGWFSSGTPSLDEALALRDALDAACASVGRTRPLRTWYRLPSADPAQVDVYAREGIDDLLVWADQVWPVDESPDRRRELIAEHGRALGLQPQPQPTG